MIGIFIRMIIITVFTYLVILGASKCKSEEEIRLEDQEQINYLNNYKNGGNKCGK